MFLWVFGRGANSGDGNDRGKKRGSQAREGKSGAAASKGGAGDETYFSRLKDKKKGRKGKKK